MDLKNIIKAEIERTMREKLNETVEVEFCIGKDKIVAKTAISYSLNDIEYSTDSSNEAIKDIIKELNVNYEEPINFMFFKHKKDYFLMVSKGVYFGNYYGHIGHTALDYADPVFPATKLVKGEDLLNGDWVMVRNDVNGFGIVWDNHIIFRNEILYIVTYENYNKLIF